MVIDQVEASPETTPWILPAGGIDHSEPPTRPPRTVEGQARSHRFIGLAVVFLVLSAFFYWSGTSSGDPVRLGGPQKDFYNQLANGFLRGELNVPMKPPKSLLDQPNPYAPPCCDLRVWDTSLYHGKLYLEYGPAPVLVLYLPWRILQLGDIPQNLAVILFAIGALAGALTCLLFMVNRYLPRTPLWKVLFAGTMLGLGGDLPFMLRSANIYEASVCGGVCFTMWGLYFLGSGALGPRPVKWRLALGSVGIGLAWGSHADLSLLGLLVVAAFVLLWRRSRGVPRADRVRTAAAVTGPFIAIGLLLAGYNYARFGSITQTGESYDVGCNCVHAPQFSPSALPEGAFLYLVAPARFSLAFPYFTLPPPPRYPGTILGWSPQEPDGGLLALAPITLDLVALPLLLRRRRSKDNRELGVVSALLVIAGGAIAFGVSSVGAVNVRFTIRLEADFATVLMLPALAIWLAIGSGGWRRKTLSVVGSVLIVFGSIVGVAISMVGYYNALYTESQHTYLNLQSATSVFPTLATKILGHPVITAVASPAGVTANIFNYTTLGVGDSLSFYLSRAASEIDVTSPDSATYDLRASFVRGSDAAPKGRILIATQNGTHAAQQRFVPGIRNLTLHLSEGLNRIHITARPAIGVTSKPGAKEVEIYSISLVRK